MQNAHGRKEETAKGNEDLSSSEFENLENRIKPRGWKTGFLEVYKCDAESCGNKHVSFQFETTQLLFEVVHDDEGGRTRAMCLACWDRRDKALGNEALPGTFRFVRALTSISRWETMTLEVDGDADKFACEFVCEKFRRA